MKLSYAILDAARFGEALVEARELNKNGMNLYTRTKEKGLEAVAPYVFPLDGNPEFQNWLQEKGWGLSWGIYITSQAPLKEIHLHFSNLTVVKTEVGKELYFRFYDPRVLRIFLPTCSSKQLKEFFGPVSMFVAEDENPANAIVYRLENYQLKSQVVPVEQVFDHKIAGPKTAPTMPVEKPEEKKEEKKPGKQKGFIIRYNDK